MPLFSGDGIFAGRRGIFAGPKFRGDAFSPLQLPGLLAWWDPSISGSITITGSGVSQLDDASGNAEHITQSTDGRRPTETTLNSLAAISMNDPSPTDQQLVNSTIVFGATQAMFQVIQPRRDASFQRFSMGNGAGTNAIAGFRISLTTAHAMQFQIGDGVARNLVQTADAIFADQETLVLVAYHDGTNIVLRVNGTEHTAASTLDPSRTGNFAYGANDNGATQGEFKGINAEAGICGILTAGQISELEGYLASKWGAVLA